MKSIFSFCVACSILLTANTLRAQPYSIDWFTIDGGGGTSAGGSYSVSGTIGQPDAGPMSGGNYSLTGGFWSIISVVQNPGSPLLQISATTTNTVVITWPSPSAGFLLQQNPQLGTVNWINVSQSPADNGTTKSVVINPPSGTLFFRLKQ